MLRPKKKISKREMKEDALVKTYVQATTFYEAHKKNISTGLVVVLVLAAGTFFYAKNKSADNERAMTDLGRVYQLFDNGQYQIAIDGVPERNISGLKTIVENYGSTDGGNMARFYLANAYFQTGKYDEALEAFDDFSPDDPLLEVSRHAGIGACFEAKGEYREAAESFEKAATKYAKDVNAAANLNHAAANYALAGDKEKALDLYRKLKKSYPTSSAARDADRYITQLSI
jgi:tetratricopeptide (TPR) repeat protein